MNQRNQIGLLVIVLLAIGCGRPANQEPKEEQADSQPDLHQQEEGELADATTDATADDADPERIIYATPEECFAAWQQASQNGDAAAKFGCLAKWDRNQRIAWYAYYLDREVFYEREHMDAAKSLLEEYGILPGSVSAHANRTAEMPVEDTANHMAVIGSKIDPQIPFVTEAAKLVEPKIGGEQLRAEDLTLTDLDIRGRLAIGRVKIATTKTTEQFYFIQEAGSWLITSNPKMVNRP